MKIKDFNKAHTIYLAIVQLDGEIIQLDKKGTLLAEKDQTCKMVLTFETEPQPSELANLQAEASELSQKYGVRVQISPVNMPFFDMSGLTSVSNASDTIDLVLSDIETLHIIDQLIQFKKIKRREYIAELKEMGYTF